MKFFYVYIIKYNKMLCPVCLQLYTRPKSLSCGHTLCIGCIVEMIENYSNIDELKCPLCNGYVMYIIDNIYFNKFINTFPILVNNNKNKHINDIFLESKLENLIDKSSNLKNKINFCKTITYDHPSYTYDIGKKKLFVELN